MRASAPPVGLQVMAILGEPAAQAVVRNVVAGTADQLSIAVDLTDGLALTQAEAPDIVFVDVGMSKGAALAVVHHLRAVVPNAVVYALAQHDALQLATQAIALGATGILMLPLSGDEVLTAMADVRVRNGERRQRQQLERQARRVHDSAALIAQVADLADLPSKREAASRLAELFIAHLGATDALVYLSASQGSRQLMQVTRVGAVASAPPFCDDMELLTWAGKERHEVLRLDIRRETFGLVVLGGLGDLSAEGDAVPLLPQVAAQAATVFALIAAREQSHRGAMKDPSSSAYTFAYFVDVAGREIDRSRRHGRRFSLATIGVGASADAAAVNLGVEVVERVLGTIRATDALARIDDLEFYLLLPETGGIGAHVCRRRVLAQLVGAAESDVTMGVATYPHNGKDLSQLLRVAKHRADISQASVVRRLNLERLPLSEILDAILWDRAAHADGTETTEDPHTIELPAIDVVALATCALTEARRGGGARVAATLRPGVSVGAAIRAALGREASEVQVELVDATQSVACQDLEVLALIAEHGSWLLLGRVERGHVRGFHAADPCLVDLVTRRLGEAARTRSVD